MYNNINIFQMILLRLFYYIKFINFIYNLFIRKYGGKYEKYNNYRIKRI